MRPNQQNRRMRGRNNSNRKGPNPLTRTYEINGPNVKIRGSAQQVADKYSALARDAMSAGDRVMAENYLQHAEHYNRIIAAATAQMQPQRDARDDDDDGDERTEGASGSDNRREDRDSRGDDSRGEDGSGSNDGSGPQPVIDGTPAEVALGDEQGEGQGSRRGRRPRRRDREQDAETAAKSEETSSDGQPTAGGDRKEAEADAREGEAEPEKPKRTRRPRKPKAETDEGKSGDGDGVSSGDDSAVEAAE